MLLLYARLLHSLKLACRTTRVYFHMKVEGCQDSLGRPDFRLEYDVILICMQDSE